MSQEGRESGSGFSFTGLAAVVLVAVGLIVQQLPLEPTRPKPSHVPRDNYPSLQKVPARLWEDPFEAIAGDLANGSNGAAGQRSTARVTTVHAEQIRARFDQLTEPDSVPCTSIMPVFVPGGRFSEYAEVRRRTRYAVVSALMRSAYFAEDEDHIGNLRFAATENTGAAPLPGTVPFEWYVSRDWRSSTGRDRSACAFRERVLVLWLDEDNFSTAPISKLHNLIERLEPRGTRVDRVRLIGPYGSKLLEDMLEEVAASGRLVSDRPSCENVRVGPVEPDAENGGSVSTAAALGSPEQSASHLWSYCAPLEIYVWGATTPEHRLMAATPDRSLTEVFADQQIALLRVNADDKAIVERLAPELKARKIMLGRDPIAVIGESDTAYGRQLVQLIAEEVSRQSAIRKAGCAEAHVNAARIDPEAEGLMIRFNYLRGLDGETAHAAREVSRSEGAKDEKRRHTELEVSSGIAHLDYARRIAAEVRRYHDELRQRDSSIAAIGILGTDFYDKSLLLQALRKEMPQAVYFTTDLDARMTDANQTRWSRNLLVVSGLGLSLDPALQKDTAPFRDNYQTAAYLSSLLALNVRLDHPSFRRDRDEPPHASVGEAAKFLADRLTPRAYEIGRHEIFDFGPAAPACATPPARDPLDGGSRQVCPSPRLLKCSRLHGDQSAPVQLQSPRSLAYALVIVITFIGLIVGTTWFTRRVLSKARGSLPHTRVLRAALVVFAVLALCAVFLIWYPGIDREPFRWAEGLSAWPTLMLRLLASVLAVCFFFALVEDQGHMEYVLRDFCLPEQPGSGKAASDKPWWWVKIRSMARGEPYLYRNMKWSIYRWIKEAPGSSMQLAGATAGMTGANAPADLWSGAATPAQLATGGAASAGEKAACRDNRSHVNARAVVSDYLELATMERRFDRVLPVFLCYLLFGVTLVRLWDLPNTPIRGAETVLFHNVVLYTYIVCYGFLLFAVVDAVRLFEALVEKLMHAETDYCPETLRRFATQLGLRLTAPIERYLSDWIDIEFIARQTESTVKLVYYPFVVLAIGIIARSQVFDNWYTPAALGIIFVLGAAYTAFATIRLRTTAERARTRAMASMANQLFALRSRPDISDATLKQLEALLDQVKTNRRGAFMPLGQQPLWKAVLLPLSGFGGVEVLQYFWLMHN